MAADLFKSEIDASRAELKNTEKRFAQENKASRERAQAVERQKQEAKNQQQPSSSGSTGQKEDTCPICSDKAKVKDKSAGKYIINLNLFFTKVVIRIPKIFDFIPKILNFDENRRSGEKCEACEGKKTIPNVADDSAKYQQVVQQARAEAPAVLEQEAKLGLGGQRHTLIQGNDTLQVGIIQNNNVGYRIEKDKGIAVKGLEGGKQPQPNAGKCNKVVPIPGELAWPTSIGNYTINCGNSFKLNSGGGGISLVTKGNLDLKGGITTIAGPQVTIASEQGPLTLGADSINISGRYINVAPSEGKFYVKGSIHSSANIIATGHTHSESMSFVKAACCGTNETSTMDQGNKDVSQTATAVWGGVGVKAIIHSLTDIQMFYADIPMDIKNAAFRLLSPAEIVNTINRFKTLASSTFPIEIFPTGICITPAGPGIIYNFPHVHGLPPMQHTHNTRVPAIDCSADSPEALRGKVLNGGTESNAPGDPVRDSLLKKILALAESVASLLALPKQIVEEVSSKIRWPF